MNEAIFEDDSSTLDEFVGYATHAIIAMVSVLGIHTFVAKRNIISPFFAAVSANPAYRSGYRISVLT